MIRIELVPTLSSCIETTAKREYQKSVSDYLEIGEEDKDLEERIELLRMFLESTDFRELRSESEKYLIEGRDVRFMLYLEEGKPKYEMKIDIVSRESYSGG